MNFGEPSPPSVDTANGFMVERVKKTPPRWNRVKNAECLSRNATFIFNATDFHTTEND